MGEPKDYYPAVPQATRDIVDRTFRELHRIEAAVDAGTLPREQALEEVDQLWDAMFGVTDTKGTPVQYTYGAGMSDLVEQLRRDFTTAAIPERVAEMQVILDPPGQGSTAGGAEDFQLPPTPSTEEPQVAPGSSDDVTFGVPQGDQSVTVTVDEGDGIASSEITVQADPAGASATAGQPPATGDSPGSRDSEGPPPISGDELPDDVSAPSPPTLSAPGDHGEDLATGIAIDNSTPLVSTPPEFGDRPPPEIGPDPRRGDPLPEPSPMSGPVAPVDIPTRTGEPGSRTPANPVPMTFAADGSAIADSPQPGWVPEPVGPPAESNLVQFILGPSDDGVKKGIRPADLAGGRTVQSLREPPAPIADGRTLVLPFIDAVQQNRVSVVELAVRPTTAGEVTGGAHPEGWESVPVVSSWSGSLSSLTPIDAPTRFFRRSPPSEITIQLAAPIPSQIQLPRGLQLVVVPAGSDASDAAAAVAAAFKAALDAARSAPSDQPPDNVPGAAEPSPGATSLQNPWRVNARLGSSPEPLVASMLRANPEALLGSLIVVPIRETTVALSDQPVTVTIPAIVIPFAGPPMAPPAGFLLFVSPEPSPLLGIVDGIATHPDTFGGFAADAGLSLGDFSWGMAEHLAHLGLWSDGPATPGPGPWAVSGLPVPGSDPSVDTSIRGVLANLEKITPHKQRDDIATLVPIGGTIQMEFVGGRSTVTVPPPTTDLVDHSQGSAVDDVDGDRAGTHMTTHAYDATKVPDWMATTPSSAAHEGTPPESLAPLEPDLQGPPTEVPDAGFQVPTADAAPTITVDDGAGQPSDVTVIGGPHTTVGSGSSGNASVVEPPLILEDRYAALRAKFDVDEGSGTADGEAPPPDEESSTATMAGIIVQAAENEVANDTKEALGTEPAPRGTGPFQGLSSSLIGVGGLIIVGVIAVILSTGGGFLARAQATPTPPLPRGGPIVLPALSAKPGETVRPGGGVGPESSGGATLPPPVATQPPPPQFVIIADNGFEFGPEALMDTQKACKDGWTVTITVRIAGIPKGTPVVVQATGPGVPPSLTFIADPDVNEAQSFAFGPGGGSWADQIVTIGGKAPPTSGATAATVFQCT